ncbi:uncharacterized protein LOC128987557 [Macrosteles quadrilineatus]|uniref:uncharacterized protein LOC128987557 n=1 Tax=Macrosteles quadrilineatus TaxID=74068 RepID=UPI0023E26BBC|nr:uncharacterized protein LOC128987557 [Macrosteles quadrilineatus]
MSYRKEPKYHKKSSPYYRPKYDIYSESETSLVSSTWEFSKNSKNSKHVKFDKEYDYSSHDDFYNGRTKDVYSYPYLYGSSNLYEAEKEYYKYDSDDSEYSQYQQSPRRTRYPDTDSAYTIGESGYNRSSFDYLPKQRQSHNRKFKSNNRAPKKPTDIGTSSFDGSLKVYYAQQPKKHKPFSIKHQHYHNLTNPSEPETLLEESVTDTEGENQKPTDIKVNQPKYQIYSTNTTEVVTSGPFNKESPNETIEKLISVTDYDKIPILAFKNQTGITSVQKSMSRVVYLPVIVMENKNNVLDSKNINNELFDDTNIDKLLNPVESVKVYSVNAGGKSIFENVTQESINNPQRSSNINENRQLRSSVLKAESVLSDLNHMPNSVDSESEITKVSKKPKSKCSYTYLPSILRMPGTRKSEISTNMTSNPNQIRSNHSIASVSSSKPIPKERKSVKKDKKSSIMSRGKAQEPEELKGETSSTFDEVREKQKNSRTKSVSNNKSQMSFRSISSMFKKNKISDKNVGNSNYSKVGIPITESAMNVHNSFSCYNEAPNKQLGMNKENSKDTKPLEESNRPISFKESAISKSVNNEIKNDNIDNTCFKSQGPDTEKIVLGNIPSIVRESKTIKGTNVPQRQSLMQPEEIKNEMKRDNTGSRQSVQNQTLQSSKRSLVKGTETGREQRLSVAKNENNTILINQDNKRNSNLKIPLSDTNVTEKGTENDTGGNKSLMVRQSVIQWKSKVNENLSRDQMDINKSTLKGTGGVSEEIKNTEQRKSQLFKLQSKEETNIDKDKPVRDISGARGSQVQRKANEGSKISRVFPNTPQEELIVTQNNEIGTNFNSPNKSAVSENRQEETSTINRKLFKESLKDKKSLISRTEDKNLLEDVQNMPKSTTMERSSVFKRFDKKSLAQGSLYKPISELKRDHETVQNVVQDKKSSVKVKKEIPTNQKNSTRESSNICTRKLSERDPSNRNSQNRRSVSQLVGASKVKAVSKQPKEAESHVSGYSSIQVFGYDISNFIICCFQISQFILGVSTYDKVIEVLGNFK